MKNTQLVSFTTPPTIAQRKRDLFVKIFKQELIRELHYFWDVANGRAIPRDNFAKKIISLLHQGVSQAPLIGGALAYLLDAADFAVTQRRNEAISTAARLVDELDLPRLEILADIVARETMYRYESFIVDWLSDVPEDGVIPFAKVGVARMLEKVMRSPQGKGDDKQIVMSEAHFLAGLIEGRSGSFIDGWRNHSLKLKKQKKGLFKPTQAEVDAEDVYARPAFRFIQISGGQLQDELYVRQKARHQEDSTLEQLKQCYRGETASLFDFGYTRFHKSKPQEPKTGYVIMPLRVIKKRYNYQLQSQADLSQSYVDQLKQTAISRIVIDIITLETYLTWHSKHPESNILDFAKQELGLMGIQLVACHDDLSGLNLAKQNLSYMDLSGAVLSGDLTETCFHYSYLIGTRFQQVTAACRSEFYQAYAPFLIAPGVNFAEADLTQANLAYANLNGADLSACKIFGAVWTQAQLQQVKSNSVLPQEQKAHLENQQKEWQQQQADIRKLNEDLQEQYVALRQLQVDYHTLLKTQPEAKANPAALKAMQDYLQREEARTAFEVYCQQEIRQLQQRLAQSVKREDIARLEAELKTTQALLAQHKQTQPTQLPTEILSALEQIAQQNGDLETKVTDFQARLTAALEQQQRVLDERWQAIHVSIHQVEQALAQRLEQVEARVENLEEWAKEAKVLLKQFQTSAHHLTVQQPSLAELEDKLNQLMAQQQEQERLSEQVALLQARLNQASSPKAIGDLQKQLAQQQATMKEWLHHPLIRRIQEQLDNLEEEVMRLNPGGNDASAKHPLLVTQLRLNFAAQVALEEEKVNHWIQPQLQIKGEEVIREKKLTENAMAKVYEGRWQHQPVMIKTTQEDFSDADKARLLREIRIISSLNHPNILRFYGAYLEDDRPFLVMEVAEQGSLAEYLTKNQLSPQQQKQIMLDIAYGLSYLHSQGILHRQLQSHYVFINQAGRAKLTGLGLSKLKTMSLASADLSQINPADQLRWCAPEWLKDAKAYRRPADIYSFGMLLWEVVTGQVPFVGCDEASLLKRLAAGQTENIPATVPTFYRDLITACWQSDPLERPALRTIIDKLKRYQPEARLMPIADTSAPSEALYQLASKEMNSKNDVEAYQHFQLASQAGHAKAQRKLAGFFLTGQGGAPQDKGKAYAYFVKAARNGDVLAMTNTAQMLEYGDGIQRDLREALSWYEKAAALGDQKAIEKVGRVQDKLNEVEPQ